MKISSCRRLFAVFAMLFYFPAPTPVFSQETVIGNAHDSPVIFEGDLPQMVQEGSLRALFYSERQGNRAISGVEMDMLEKFAKENSLTLELIKVDTPWQLVPELLAGKGDVIIGQGKSLAAGMNDQVRFTSPWTTFHQQIIVRADTTQIARLDDLAFRQVALKRTSPAWGLLEELAKKNSTMDLVVIPETLAQDDILKRVTSGQYDVAVVDSEFLKARMQEHRGLNVAYDLTEGDARAWAVHPQATSLQVALDQFLNKNHLALSVTDVHLDDLPKMQERNTLRVITYQNPANYYFNDGKLHGFEYELIKKFAQSRKMRVDVVLAKSHEEMQELLLGGKGDIIAASLPAGSVEHDQTQQSEPYNYSAPVIIGRKTDSEISDIYDLEGRRIILPGESPYRKLLEGVHARGINFDIVEAGPGLNTEVTLSLVSLGMYDLTILGSHQLKAELAKQTGIKAHFALSAPLPHAWVVRATDTQLLAAVNNFVNNQYRSKFYNTLYAKYFEKPDNNISSNKLLTKVDHLSPYDDIVREYAEKYGFDWRLIVAQMYQESQFDPDAISYAGAEGLMQILPETAELVGTDDLADPDKNIHGGVKYLSMLRNQFESDLLLEDRTWFSLASYNAGFNRVKRARDLAAKMGLDENRWFGNVEQAMLVLARPFEKEGETIRNCRCGQTVVYVREIRTLYNNYVRLTQSTQVAESGTHRISPYDI